MKVKKVKLGDICNIVSGSTPSTNIPEYWDGEYNWVAPNELNEDTKYIFSTNKKITKLAIEKAGLKLLPVGTVLLSSRAPIGKVAIAGSSMYCNQGFKNLICSDKIYNEFLYWYLVSKKEYLNSIGRGATFKELSKTLVESVIVPLPDLHDQRRIAATLDKADAICRKRKECIKMLDELVKARFVEMFGDTKLNSKNLKLINLDEIANVGSSKRVFVNELTEYGIPFYRGTEIGILAEGKKIIPELYISEEHYNKLIKYSGIPKIGDLLLPSICPDGRIWLVDTDIPFYFKDGRVLWISIINKKFNSVFILHSLKNRLLADYNNFASGTTFAELKICTLKKCKIFNVSISEQKIFSSFVLKIETIKSSMQSQLQEAETLKAALMQQYFSQPAEDKICA